MSAPAPPDRAYEVSLLHLGSVLLRERYAILRFTLVCTLAVALVILVRPRTWSVTATFMPQSRRVTGNLQGLAAQFGLPIPLGDSPQQSPAFYADVLRSRAILAGLLDSTYRSRARGTPQSLELLLGAKGRTQAERRTDALRRLTDATDAWVTQKTGIVNVQVRTRDPLLSLELTDALLRGLDRFNKQIRQSQATAERRFTERRLEEVRRELRSAEDAQQAFFQRNRAYEGSVSLRFQQERLARDVSVKQQLFMTISEAFEQARIEEIRDTPVMTVLSAPELPSSPDDRRLALACTIAALVSLLIAIVLAFLRDATSSVADATHDFHRLRGEAIDDARHPFRTLGRLVVPRRRVA